MSVKYLLYNLNKEVNMTLKKKEKGGSRSQHRTA